MVFNSYSRIENETESLLDTVPSSVSPTPQQQQQRDRSMSSPPPPPRPSFRPSHRTRAISDPSFGQLSPGKWQPLEDFGEEETGDMYNEDDQEDLLVVSRPTLTRKKSSGLGLFKQNVLKAVGIKS